MKLGRCRPLCLSCVQVGFESPKWVMVIRDSVLLRTLLFEEKMSGEMLAEGNHGLPTIYMSFFSYWVSACTFDKWESDTPPLPTPHPQTLYLCPKTSGDRAHLHHIFFWVQPSLQVKSQLFQEALLNIPKVTSPSWQSDKTPLFLPLNLQQVGYV